LEKTTVLKKSSVIRIEHNISLLQQQVWNVLLTMSLDQLDRNTYHKFPIVSLLKYIPAATNRQHLEKAVLELVDHPLRFGVLPRDGRQTFERYPLLSGARFSSGVCYYQFPADLIPILDGPSDGSEIDLAIQKNYKGGSYGWFLYELCLDDRDQGKTGWLSLEDLRRYLGISTDRYPLFKDLNKRVIKPAIKDIKSRTNLDISAEFKREGRKVVAIQFLIEQSFAPKSVESSDFGGTNKQHIFQQVIDYITDHSDSFKQLGPLFQARLKREIFSNYISDRAQLTAMISDSKELADSFYKQQVDEEAREMAALKEEQEVGYSDEMNRALRSAEARLEITRTQENEPTRAMAIARKSAEYRDQAERSSELRDIEELAEAGRRSEQRQELLRLKEREEADSAIREARKRGIERLKHLLG